MSECLYAISIFYFLFFIIIIIASAAEKPITANNLVAIL